MSNSNENQTYQYLAPLPGQPQTINVSQPNNLGIYLNNMISIFIGISAVLAVIMIVIGGIEYMTSELISGKEAGKERIRNAILGLLIALAAYAILFTINPNILNVDLKGLDSKINSATSSLFKTPVAYAQDQKYKLLAPLPDPYNPGKMYDTFDPQAVGGGNNSGELSKYLNLMIMIVIGLCAVLAVIMIVIGGIEYMTSELISGKEAGKERIRNAILGLLIALLAYPLLYTINTGTLNADLGSLTQATLTIKERQEKVYSGQGKEYCTPITDPSNPCYPANLASYFGAKADEASSICNAESSGRFDVPSGVDLCSADDYPFSWGLFQINIFAHQNEIGVCKGAFERVGARPTDCKVVNQVKYQQCVDYITVPTNNIGFALKLFQSNGNRWGTTWGANRSCGFQ